MDDIEVLLAKIKGDPDRLRGLTLAQLGLLWRHCLPKQPVPHLKCLIWQGLAFFIQAGKQPLALSTQKCLQAAMKQATLVKADSLSITPVLKVVAPMPEGTRLVRKWRGRNYEILVNDADFHFNGKSYKSLSHIAEEITGAHWSGPRFFGLNKKLKECTYV